MKRFKFQAKIEAADRGGAFVLFPYDVEKEFSTKARIPVQATFDGVPYAGSLMKYGHEQHMLGLLKGIREQIGKGPGDVVSVELWKDEQQRTVEVPEALQTAMQRAGVTEFFQSLSYSHQREYCRWITEAKKEETRSKRIGKAVEILANKVKTPDTGD